MTKVRIKPSLNRIFLLYLPLLCSLFVSEDAYSQVKRWNRSYFTIGYNFSEKSAQIQCYFFDYSFGPLGQNGYLSYCDFFYSTDGENYYYLMRAETKDQKKGRWAWLTVKNKIASAQIKFCHCYSPASGFIWPDNQLSVRIEVSNMDISQNKAKFHLNWVLGSAYKNVNFIRIIGQWHRNGLGAYDFKFDEVYKIPAYPLSFTMKPINLDDNESPVKTPESENNNIKVSSEADAVVIKGVDFHENIKVYTATGTHIKSFVSKHDLIKIKLPSNQVYFVYVGLSLYKVVL